MTETLGRRSMPKEFYIQFEENYKGFIQEHVLKDGSFVVGCSFRNSGFPVFYWVAYGTSRDDAFCNLANKLDSCMGVTYSKHTIKDKKKRLFTLIRYNKKCVICGADDNLTIDHVIPRSAGGHNGYSNLAILCEPCNNKKDSHLMEDFVGNDV